MSKIYQADFDKTIAYTNKALKDKRNTKRTIRSKQRINANVDKSLSDVG